MVKTLGQNDWIHLGRIIALISSMKNRRFMKYYIVKIIDNSNDISFSLGQIESIVREADFDEDRIVESLVQLFELQNTNRLNELCRFYND